MPIGNSIQPRSSSSVGERGRHGGRTRASHRAAVAGRSAPHRHAGHLADLVGFDIPPVAPVAEPGRAHLHHEVPPRSGHRGTDAPTRTRAAVRRLEAHLDPHVVDGVAHPSPLPRGDASLSAPPVFVVDLEQPPAHAGFAAPGDGPKVVERDGGADPPQVHLVEHAEGGHRSSGTVTSTTESCARPPHRRKDASCSSQCAWSWSSQAWSATTESSRAGTPGSASSAGALVGMSPASRRILRWPHRRCRTGGGGQLAGLGGRLDEQLDDLRRVGSESAENTGWRSFAISKTVNEDVK